ncbi:hypothetical protein L596_010140 [Steinernema carpocapsae]|uniref:Uncharacterized protein n=1 Tax=Steinernema carpocapsae TaxID=34508 RepID=A0A4U5PHX4_STECR|nr:hypothetical protein L596_010140 [Steinernema carpocapsae]
MFILACISLPLTIFDPKSSYFLPFSYILSRFPTPNPILRHFSLVSGLISQQIYEKPLKIDEISAIKPSHSGRPTLKRFQLLRDAPVTLSICRSAPMTSLSSRPPRNRFPQACEPRRATKSLLSVVCLGGGGLRA